MEDIEIKYINGPNGYSLGYKYREGNGPCLVWLCGFHSDMSGTKASKMDEFAKNHALSSLRFDYSGTGVSQGKFEDGTIGKWLNEALFLIEKIIKENIILIGSSMGGWLALKIAQKLQNKISAIILIAPAPDFTQDLMWNKFTPEIKNEILINGYWIRPSIYDDNGYKITRELIEDGKNNLILHEKINVKMPIRILHGMKDEDVPFMRSIELIEKIESDDVELNLVKNGDHRLSSEENLKLLYRTIENLCDYSFK